MTMSQKSRKSQRQIAKLGAEKPATERSKGTIQVASFNTGLSVHPALVVSVPKTEHYRRLQLLLHYVAAAVELASGTEGWVVEINTTSDTRGYVHLELARDDESERARATRLLENVARGEF